MAKQGGKKLRFHVPFTAAPPSLISEAAGIARLVQRPSRSRSVDATVLDTPDNRLLRAGVVVAHRVVDGLGDWYLSSRGWDPHLAPELSLPLDSGELPPDIARRIRPISRGATLGPVATLDCDRQEFDLVGARSDVLAAIRDEKVTVRRGGVATARFREVTVQPTPSMTPQQREFILQTMDSISATAVTDFPTLQQRLGPPATGLTDFPAPGAVGKDATMEELVTSVFAADLRALTFELLAAASADDGDVVALNARLRSIRRDVQGLAHVLEPEWRENVEQQLAGVPFQFPSDAVSHALAVSDALVGGVRAPKLGDVSHQRAASLLFKRAERATYILADRCRALEDTSPDAAWVAAAAAAEQLSLSAAVGGGMLGRRVRRTLTLLDELADHLTACLQTQDEAPLEGLTASEAYALGAAMERRRGAVQAARSAFVAAWPDRIRRLRKLLEKSRKRA